jgi:Phage integrase family
MEECGFDIAFYRVGPLVEQLNLEGPDGIDVYFDNLGGEALEAAISTPLNECGTNPRDVQALLGHKSIATTARYTHVDSERPRTVVGNLRLQTYLFFLKSQVRQTGERVGKIAAKTVVQLLFSTGKSFTVDGLREKAAGIFPGGGSRGSAPRGGAQQRGVNHRAHFLQPTARPRSLPLRILNGVVSLLTTEVHNKALAAYLSEQSGARRGHCSASMAASRRLKLCR